MGQEVSSAAAGDGNFAVKGAADAVQKRHSAQCEPDTRILSEPIIPSHRKDSQSSKKRKRDPELDNAMSFSRNRTPPHRLSNTFHRDQESPVQTRVRSRSPPASDVRIDEVRRLRDHWSPTHRGEDPARSSHFEGAHAHWSRDRTTSRPGRFSWSPASSSRKSRRWTPSPPARAFDRAVKSPRSPDRPDTSLPRREEEPNRSTLYSTAVPRSERYLQKPSRRSPSPPKKHYRSADNLASNPNHKGASRQTPGQRRSVIPQHSPQHSLKSPCSPSNSRNLINFNGLKAVPTGPKTALQYSGLGAATPIADINHSLPTRTVLQDVDESVRTAPHAFLSSRWLPPQEATIQHLRGYFAKRSPGSIFVDDYGYYLLFNDDEEGHLNMDRLVAETPHRDKLFGMYPLTLEAYHNGQQQPDFGPTKPFDSHKGSTKELREEPAGLIANDLHEEDDLMGLSNKKGDITRRKDVGEKISTTTPKRMQPKSEVSRLLSPSRTTGRQETDDTSSVSARTGTPSELSTSRRTRCHVCKADSSMHMGDLMICSSCPRRWHRACHEVPPFAPDSISDVNWQCRRCIKRQVPLPESSDELRTFAQVATIFEPVPDHSRARQAGSQESSSQAKNGSNVVKEGTRKSAFPASLHESHPFDQQTAERTSNTIVEGPNPPKRSNIIVFSDRPNSPDGSRTETLAQKVAGAHREAGKGRHQEHYLDFKDDEASDLVEQSFTQTTPSTVAVFQDTKAKSKTQFKRIKISREPSKAAQSRESTSASNNVQRLAAPEHSAQQLRRPEVKSDKARSAMHDAEIQTAPEVPESPAELRNSFVDESAAAEHLSKSADVASASSTVGTPLSQPLATPNVAAKPKAKRTRQSFVICSVCQENKAYTSNPHAQAYCSMCKQQQQQEQIIAKVGEQSTHKNTGVEPQGSKSLVDGSMERSRQVRKEGTSAARPLEAAESRERSNDDVQINANVVNGESPDSLAPNEWTASTNLPAHMDLCNSTGPATVPARFQDNQIERTDPVHGRDVRTPDDVDVSTSVQENVCEEQPLDGCSTIEDSRPTKRKRRNFTDGNFPGNSHARAKGSYIRLIGMALCDAPNHRMQLRGIAAWIAEKIPSYELGVGNWEHGLKVTLGAHVGVKGKMMFKAVDFKPGVDDDRHGSKEWYQMHETVASTHERWDPGLKQAVSPAFASPEEATEVVGASQQEKASGHKHGVGNDDAPDDHHYGEASPAGPTEDRLGQAQAAKFLKGPTGSQQGYPSVTDFSSRHVDVDENAANKNTKAVEDSEDEPLNAVRRRYPAPEARMKAPEHAGKEQGFPRPNQELSTAMIAPEEADCDAGTLPTTNTWRSPTRGAADDDRSLFEPTTQGEQDVTHTALSLFDEWPEYHPANQIDREAKIAEIKRRPSRKAMFGKPALYSRLGGHEALQSGHSKHQIGNLSTEKPSEKQGLPARKVAHSIDPFPVEPNVVYYGTPEEFFGLPHYLSPVMYDGQLAYRDGTKDHSSRVRKAQAYFPTGLGG